MSNKKRNRFICLIAALALAGCSSAGEGLADAITDPLTPKPKGHYQWLGILSPTPNVPKNLLPDDNSTITITDDEKQGADREKTYKSGDTFNIGHKKLDKITELVYKRKAGDGSTDEGKLLLYRQDYSAIVGTIATAAKNADGSDRAFSNKLFIDSVQGKETNDLNIPDKGEARYKGTAFAGAGYSKNGTLDYTVNFGDRTGRGKITGLPGFRDITLEEAVLYTRDGNTTGVDDGKARSADLGEGSYSLTLFGPKYEEIAGDVYFDKKKQGIGIAGKKVSEKP